MTLPLLRRAFTVGFGTAGTLALCWGLSGCGGSTPESGESVLVPEPGAAVPTVGSPAASPGGAGGSPAAANTPAAASTTPAATTSPSTGKAEGWGTLKGQVVFGSTPPEPTVLIEPGKAPKDPEVCAKDRPIKNERLIVDGATKGVKNVLVFLPKPTAVNDEAKSAASKADVVFDQNRCVFEPHVLGIMAGAKITLKSSDPVNHNVNAKLKNSAPFNSLLAAGQSLPFSPSAAERTPAAVTCDIHPWMLAYWMVLDNPYFAVTDDKGNFEIKNAPAGSQKVVVWQEATSFVTAPSGEEVTIKANDTTSKSFTIDPGKVKPAR